jgi:hypothetical protein
MRVLVRFALSLFFLARAAAAQETLDDLDLGAPRADATPASHATVTGYLVNRESYSRIDPFVPLSTRDMPSLSQLIEANAQIRVPLGSQQSFGYADLSLIFQRGGLYYADAGAAGRTRVSNHDVASQRPAFIPSELYLSYSPKPWLNALLGKKRVTWGAGFAYNPTDLVNPPKDPTDPNFQRAGNWVARLEFPFEKFTASALFAPQALYTTAGIPYALVRYPSYAPADTTDQRDRHTHYLTAGRLYWLVADADVNLVYYFSNHYEDAFAKKSRFGVSFSRYFWTDYELHVEALLGRGSARSFPDHACAAHVESCGSNQGFALSKLESGRVYPRVILGTRRQFASEATLSVEYYYQGDGYSRTEFRDAVELLLRAKSMAPAEGNNSSNGSALSNGSSQSNGSGSALPQRFSLNTMRRHYLIASYSQPRIFDDWTLGAVLIAGIEDLSGLVSPSVAWSAAECLTLSLFGYVPIRGLGVNEARVRGKRYDEYSLMPFDWRVLFEARAFY